MVTKCGAEIFYCLNEDVGAPQLLANFSKIYQVIEGILTAPPRKKSKQCKGWFDYACSEALKLLKQALHNKPRNNELFKNLHFKYKSGLKIRRRKLQELAWDKLQMAEDTANNKLFWETVNAPFLKCESIPELLSHVNCEAWVIHFSSIFNPIEYEGSRSQSPTQIRWPVIPLNITLEGIHREKGRESTGPG